MKTQKKPSHVIVMAHESPRTAKGEKLRFTWNQRWNFWVLRQTHSKNGLLAKGCELTRIDVGAGFCAVVEDMLRFRFCVGHIDYSFAWS
jgi:hypothetical protein